jgi:hypothetical protein
VSRELMARLEECAKAAGFSTGRDVALRVLEGEIAKLEDADSSEKIEERLRGLGYIP